MNSIKEHEIAQTILKAYEQNIFYLPQKNIGHFFERAYRMTGDDKYMTTLSQHFFIKQVNLLTKQLPTLRDHVNNDTAIELVGTFAQKNPRQTNRYSAYKQNPQIPFFNSLILNLYFIQSVGLHTSCCTNLYTELSSLLKKIDFDKIYYSKDIILNVGSFAINSVIFLDYLELDKNSLKQRLIKLVKDHYLDEDLVLRQKLNKWEYYTFIYNLTHIIIAESNFYEKSVDDHQWIIKYLTENTQEIIQNTTIDILAEVGLCIKLTKQEEKYAEALRMIKNHILENYDIEEKLTLKYIAKKEHTNSIIMLLFFQNDNWHPGPNLSKETIFNNLTLS